MSSAVEHPDWWTETDAEILRGAMEELDNLPRPAYIEPERDRLAYREIVLPKRVRRAREIGAWIMLTGILAAVLLVASWLGEGPHDAPCPDQCGFTTMPVQPWTYAPPGPNGGAR